MDVVGLVFICLSGFILLCGVFYIFFTRFRAQRAGLPLPPLSSLNPFSHRHSHSQHHSAPSEVIGWIQSKFQFLGSSKKGGVYQQPLSVHGRSGLDPDEAWDARVGNEADGYGAGGYYEEQELELHPQAGSGAYSGGGYGERPRALDLPEYGEEIERGRSLSRDGERNIGGGQRGLDERYDQEMGSKNPFGDDAEHSDLKRVSPSPFESDRRGHSKKDSGDSPTERRSVFRENV